MRTQVGIIGAGPSGLLLSHLLHLAGIDSVVIEARSRTEVEGRERAGLLEEGTVETLTEAGLGARLRLHGFVQHGFELRFEGASRRIRLARPDGRPVTLYGQQELVKDLIAARLAAGTRGGQPPILFGAEAVAPQEVTGDAPRIAFRQDGRAQALDCDFVAGCDGFDGVARAAIPAAAQEIRARAWPFAWLGVLVRCRPPGPEVVHARHAEGFAMAAMRTEGVTRFQLQCQPQETAADWPDARIREALHRRLGPAAAPEGAEILRTEVTPVRSAVCVTMRHGRLFLAGDAAHLVPPTAGKGLNLAVADIRVLAAGFELFYRRGETDLLARYGETCLRRVWQVQRFSAWMTALLHRCDDDPFEQALRLAELEQVSRPGPAMAALVQAYGGLPFEV